MAKFFDKQGRIFGIVSLLDVLAVTLILLVLVGVILVPGNNGYSIAQLVTAESKPVRVEMVVRGLSVRDPQNLIKVGDRVSVVIRNQPRGEVAVESVVFIEPKVLVPSTDGQPKAMADPRAQETFQTDAIIALTGSARITNDGVIFGNEKVKVGTGLDIESPNYILRGSTMAVRF